MLSKLGQHDIASLMQERMCQISWGYESNQAQKMFRSIWLIKWGLNLAYQGHDQAKKVNLKLDKQDEFELNSKCYKLNGEQIRIAITHLDQSMILVQAQIGQWVPYMGPTTQIWILLKTWARESIFGFSHLEWISLLLMSELISSLWVVIWP